MFSNVTSHNNHHRILKLPVVHRHLASSHSKLVSTFWFDPIFCPLPNSHSLPLCPLDCRVCLWQDPFSSQCSSAPPSVLGKRCCSLLLPHQHHGTSQGVFLHRDFCFPILSPFPSTKPQVLWDACESNCLPVLRP